MRRLKYSDKRRILKSLFVDLPSHQHGLGNWYKIWMATLDWQAYTHSRTSALVPLPLTIGSVAGEGK